MSSHQIDKNQVPNDKHGNKRPEDLTGSKQDEPALDEELADVQRAFVTSTYQRMHEISRGLLPRPYRRRQKKRSDQSSPDDADVVETGGWKPGPGMAKSRTGTGKSRWDPQPVGQLMNSIARKPVWKIHISLGTVIAQWSEIAGKSVAEHSNPESLEEGRLTVKTDSTAWAKQLQLLLPQIEKSIDEVLGTGVVIQVIVHGPEKPSWNHGKLKVKGRGPRDTYA